MFVELLEPTLVHLLKKVKMESIRKLSNFNFQWTKSLYQNNLKHIAFFLLFSRIMDVISKLSVITPEKNFYGSLRKKKIQISLNELLCMKFYLCFHNSCEI